MLSVDFLRYRHIRSYMDAYCMWQGLYITVFRSLHLTDINECLNNNGSCSHDCFNTVGSYYCECPTGHDLLPNNLDCEGSYAVLIIRKCYANI